MRTNVTLTDYLFSVTDYADHRYFTSISGWMLIAILIIMVLSSLPVVRRSGKFEVFYYCHLFYVVYFITLLYHGPRFWHWLLIPGILFVIEMLNRIRNYLTSRGSTHVVQGVVLPSKVVHLIIKRPETFDFSPGDFVFVQIPGVAKTEWHPFTISSAPEMTDYLWLHIRAVGGWTNKVYEYFLTEEKRLLDEITSQNKRKRMLKYNSVKLYETKERSRPSAYHLLSDLSWMNKSTASSLEISNMPGLTQPERMVLDSNPIANRQALSQIFPNYQFIERNSLNRRHSIIYVLPEPDELHSNNYNSVKKRKRRGFTWNSRSSSRLPLLDAIHLPDITEQCSLSIEAASHPSESLVSGKIIKLENPMHLRLDGPYGSPASQIFHSNHAILIGAGIGVTPFASILQSIMFRYVKAKNTCPSCNHSWSNPIPPNIMNLKKVDFLWINRDQKSFEWFVSLLAELETIQSRLNEQDRFLDIHMYMTSAQNQTNMGAVALQLALDLIHTKEKRDMITRLITKTKPGRPDWNSFFQQMSNQMKGPVTVFFCGPPKMGSIIRSHCIPFGFDFKKEIF